MYDKEKFKSAQKVLEAYGKQMAKEFEEQQRLGTKVSEIKTVRDGNVIKVYITNGSRIELKLMEVREMILKLEEKMVLENMTDEEFTRFKKVVDAEWMRRKTNGNN